MKAARYRKNAQTFFQICRKKTQIPFCCRASQLIEEEKIYWEEWNTELYEDRKTSPCYKVKKYCSIGGKRGIGNENPGLDSTRATDKLENGGNTLNKVIDSGPLAFIPSATEMTDICSKVIQQNGPTSDHLARIFQNLKNSEGRPLNLPRQNSI